MAGTTLSDVIVPELFTPYVVNRTMEKSAFVTSGIMVRNAAFDALASEAARTHNMPFFEDLSGDAQNIVEGQKIEFQKITSNKDVSTTIMRQQKWSATALSAALAGTDPMRAIGDLVSDYWARQYQKELINILSGVFSADSMKDHILDISGGTGVAANIGATAVIDALQLMGDAQDQLTAIVMHSATKAYLKKLNLIPPKETVLLLNSIPIRAAALSSMTDARLLRVYIQLISLAKAPLLMAKAARRVLYRQKPTAIQTWAPV